MKGEVIQWFDQFVERISQKVRKAKAAKAAKDEAAQIPVVRVRLYVWAQPETLLELKRYGYSLSSRK